MTQRLIINPAIKLAPPTALSPLTKDEIEHWADGLDEVLGIVPTPEAKPQPQPVQPTR